MPVVALPGADREALEGGPASGADVLIQEFEDSEPAASRPCPPSPGAPGTSQIVADQAASAALRETARRLRDPGLPVRDVGSIMGISAQRVSQLLAR